MTTSILDVTDRILSFENAVVPHTNHADALAAIRYLHSRHRPAVAAERFMARALLLIGASGAGKTTALQSYRSAYPELTIKDLERTDLALDGATRERLLDGDIKRIIYVETPERATRRSLVAELISAFGYKAKSTSNTSELVERIAFLAEELQTEMIFIDEGHHFINEKNPDATLEVTEFIKSLLNRVKVQIVIAGLPSLLQIAIDDPRTAQLRRRLQAPVYLAPYDWRTKAGRVRFLSLLKALEVRLGLPEPSGLNDQQIAKRLYVATGGEVGIVSKYLSEALRRAISDDLPNVTLDLLAKIHEGWSTEAPADGEILDFDDLLDDPIGATSAENPFVCSDVELLKIWATRHPTAEPAQGSRLTRSRATGRAAYHPFSSAN